MAVVQGRCPCTSRGPSPSLAGISCHEGCSHAITILQLQRPGVLHKGRLKCRRPRPVKPGRLGNGTAHGLCRFTRCSATEISDSERAAFRSGRNWMLGLWTALDVGATLGSIGGAVAFILTQEALLVSLPVVLPLFALYASRRRESMKVEVSCSGTQCVGSAEGFSLLVSSC
jgi:hypothetical protein